MELKNIGPRPGQMEEQEDRGNETPPLQTARRERRRLFSGLTWRIFAPNVVALAVLVGGVFYLDQYRDSLLSAKIDSLQTEAELMAAALSVSALTGTEDFRRIDPYRAVNVVQRLAGPVRGRARLFGEDGILIADSRELIGAGRVVLSKNLSAPQQDSFFSRLFEKLYDWLLPRLPSSDQFPPYREKWAQSASDYEEAAAALSGQVNGQVRVQENGGLVVSIAVPVQDLRHVVGALLLSAESDDIEAGVRQARTAVLQAFALALAITVLISIYLARTIERPLRSLADAADRVRRWRGQRVQIPDLSQRRDEIGDLSVDLREMTNALYSRLDAIEAFAADVAHEIKNPLSSLRSAMESMPVAQNEDQRARLIAIMQNDVRRLDRLISDISNASRLDSELIRETREAVDLAGLLEMVVGVHQNQASKNDLQINLSLPDRAVMARVLPDRIGQVMDNLLSNARSFSPRGGRIDVSLEQQGDYAVIKVEDQGPGVDEEVQEKIFDRFYTKRPRQEAFGEHSGLGLSIARQIVSAHNGDLRCENRRGQLGPVTGARFILRLPIK